MSNNTRLVVERVETRLWRHIIGNAPHDGACRCLACFERHWQEVGARVPIEIAIEQSF